MIRNMKKWILVFSTLLVLTLLAGPIPAADFPTKPVTLIVPWTAGGSTDVLLRILAETTAKHLGQPIIVENKPGGGGSVGPATMVATAKPDGYTISQIPITVFRYPLMMKVIWDPLKDFTYIIHLTGYTFGVVVKKDAPWKTFNELVAYAKANPGKVTYATPGAGTSLHTTMEMIALKQGFQMDPGPHERIGGNDTGGFGRPCYRPRLTPRVGLPRSTPVTFAFWSPGGTSGPRDGPRSRP